MTHHQQFLRCLVIAFAIALAAAVTAAKPAIAAIGTYTEILCSNPDTGSGTGLLPPEVTVPRSTLIGADYQSFSSCSGQMSASKGLVLASGWTGHYADSGYGALRYDAPAGITIQSASWSRFFWSARGNSSFFTVTEHGADDPGNFYGLPRGDGFYWYGTNGTDGNAVTTGSSSDLYGAGNQAAVAIGGATHWTVTAGCDSAGRGGCDVNQSDVSYRIFGGKVILYDDAYPQATGAPSGGLVTENRLSGTHDISFGATDVGSGLYRVRLAIDGVAALAQPADTNSGRCADVNVANADPYEFPVGRPCRLSVNGTYEFDTTSLPEGVHTLRVEVEDAGGNAATLVNRSVTIDNVPPPVNIGLPAIAGQAREQSGLAGTEGTWTGAGPITYGFQWQRCDAMAQGCADIDGATAHTYTVNGQDVGRRLRLRVRATNSEGPTDAVSAPTDVVSAPPDVVVASGEPVVFASPTTRELTLEPGAPNGSHASEHAVLDARDSHTGHRVVRVRWGHRVRISGRLLTPGGQPISGALLEVHTRTRLAGALSVSAPGVLTDTSGRFRYVAAPGPSRAIRFGYRTHIGDATFARTTEVELRVRAGLRFHLSRARLRNGATLRYLGRLLGPRTGHHFVEVQVGNGRRWQVVCAVRTDGRGAFACAHRFTRTFVPTTYTFRARVRRQLTLPYEPATSLRRTARVRP